jgi:hypothetical protein
MQRRDKRLREGDVKKYVDTHHRQRDPKTKGFVLRVHALHVGVVHLQNNIRTSEAGGVVFTNDDMKLIVLTRFVADKESQVIEVSSVLLLFFHKIQTGTHA